MCEELVELLTYRVRVLSVEQIARAFRCGDVSAAEALIRPCESAGLITRQNVLARPALPLVEPVVAWRPGAQIPDFGKVAYRLKSRWCEALRPIELMHATRTAAREFGGYLGGRGPRASETTHDLNLAAVFLWHRDHLPEDATAWVPEAQLYAEGRGLRLAIARCGHSPAWR